MERIVKFLQECGIFYVATADGAQPRVRPFGAISIIGGNMVLATNNTKAVYRQLTENPKIEISATLPDMRWIRVTAETVLDDSFETKEQMLALNPVLTRMYRVDDGIFTTIRLTGGTAKLEAFGKAPEIITF